MSHDAHAQKAELAGSIFGDGANDPRDEGLLSEHFHVATYREIHEAMVGLARNDDPIDEITVHAALSGRVTAATILEIAATAVTDANFSHYAGVIRQHARVREYAKALSVAIVYGEDTDKEALAVADELARVAGSGVGSKTVTMLQLMTSGVRELERRSLEKKVHGLSTGLRDLDEMIGGLDPGDVVVIAARPGVGKTALALGAMIHLTGIEKKHASFYSLEMTEVQMADRLLSSGSGVDMQSIRTGTLGPTDFSKLAAAGGVLGTERGRFEFDCDVTVADIRAKEKSRKKRSDIIFVDYLNLLTSGSSKGSASRENEVSGVSRDLKKLASSLNVPVVALAQINRGPMSRQDQRPKLSDLRESGAIEQDASVVVMLYRDDEDKQQPGRKGVTEANVAKNRNGPTGVVELNWDGRRARYMNRESYHG